MLSRGEAKDTERARQYILADTLEALIGALYLDRGYQECEKFVRAHLIPELPKIIEEKKYVDDKSYFQERAQESGCAEEDPGNGGRKFGSCGGHVSELFSAISRKEAQDAQNK